MARIESKTLTTKQESIVNQISDESFIIGMALNNGMKIELQRKEKRSDKQQKFMIISVNDQEIMDTVENEFNKWLEKVDRRRLRKRESYHRLFFLA